MDRESHISHPGSRVGGAFGQKAMCQRQTCEANAIVARVMKEREIELTCILEKLYELQRSLFDERDAVKRALRDKDDRIRHLEIEVRRLREDSELRLSFQNAAASRDAAPMGVSSERALKPRPRARVSPTRNSHYSERSQTTARRRSGGELLAGAPESDEPDGETARCVVDVHEFGKPRQGPRSVDVVRESCPLHCRPWDDAQTFDEAETPPPLPPRRGRDQDNSISQNGGGFSDSCHPGEISVDACVRCLGLPPSVKDLPQRYRLCICAPPSTQNASAHAPVS